MRIFIKADQYGFPATRSAYAAWQGFRILGYEPVLYKTAGELAGCRPDDLIVGGVSDITERLASYGIPVPEYDYPEELTEFLGRRVWKSTLDKVLQERLYQKMFVKPVRDKVFTGLVVDMGTNAAYFRHARRKEPVLCSEPVDFMSEWRAFVRYGKIWDVRPYRGDWHCQFDPVLLDIMAEAFESAPAGYAMDVGVTEDGRTLLVEINDGFALDCYGADPVMYAKTLSARWCELTGIHDECDTYMEAVDWKKKKPAAEKEDKDPQKACVPEAEETPAGKKTEKGNAALPAPDAHIEEGTAALPVPAMDLAKYIVKKCIDDKSPVSNMELQRILFLIQKEFVGLGRLAFPDPVEAWEFGPAVRNVYYHFCGSGVMPIYTAFKGYGDLHLDYTDKWLVDRIIEEARNMNPWDADKITKGDGSAWQQVFDGSRDNRKEISRDCIRKAAEERKKKYV